MFKRCYVSRGYKSADVFHSKRSLSRNSVSSKKVVERGPQELAIDQEFKGDRFFSREQAIDER